MLQCYSDLFPHYSRLHMFYTWGVKRTNAALLSGTDINPKLHTGRLDLE